MQLLQGGIIHPDHVVCGVVIQEALRVLQVQIHAVVLIGRCGVVVDVGAQGGLVVAEGQQHDGPLALPEPVDQLQQLLIPLGAAAQIVVHGDAVGAVGVHLHKAGGIVVAAVMIGAVALIGDSEVEIGPVMLLQIGLILVPDLIEQDPVVGNLIFFLHQLVKAVLPEQKILEAQVAVDVPPVVEPAVEGMGPLGVVALAPQIPDVGICRLPPFPQGVVTRQEAAQVARQNGFCLQMVVIVIGGKVDSALPALCNRELRQI